MKSGAVANVFFEAVMRKFVSVVAHNRVACDLREDRSGGDGAHVRVPFYDGNERNIENLFVVAVDEGDVGLMSECRDAKVVGEARGVEDVVLING